MNRDARAELIAAAVHALEAERAGIKRRLDTTDARIAALTAAWRDGDLAAALRAMAQE